MDKKEFIFPGTILGIVLIVAIGLIITQPNNTAQISTTGLATSTAATSTTTATIEAGTMSSTSHPTTPGLPTHYYPYGTTVLSVNQVAGFKNAVSIRPVAVITDSRCPAEVFCIQAGTVTVSLKVSAHGQSTLQNVSLGQMVTVSGMQITFESAEPVRHAQSAPETSAYRFTFTVVPAQ